MLNIAPTATPPALTIDEAKLHLRVEDSAEDALILSLIVAATPQLSTKPEARHADLAGMVPAGRMPPPSPSRKRRPPPSSSNTTTGVQQTLPDADYVLIPGDVPAIIRTSPARPGCQRLALSRAPHRHRRLRRCAECSRAHPQWIKLRRNHVHAARSAYRRRHVTETPVRRPAARPLPDLESLMPTLVKAGCPAPSTSSAAPPVPTPGASPSRPGSGLCPLADVACSPARAIKAGADVPRCARSASAG